MTTRVFFCWSTGGQYKAKDSARKHPVWWCSAVKYRSDDVPAEEWVAGRGQTWGNWAKGSDARSRQDRAGGLSGLNLGTPAAGRSGTIEADVATLGGFGVEVGLRQEVVAERFQ